MLKKYWSYAKVKVHIEHYLRSKKAIGICWGCSAQLSGSTTLNKSYIYSLAILILIFQTRPYVLLALRIFTDFLRQYAIFSEVMCEIGPCPLVLRPRNKMNVHNYDKHYIIKITDRAYKIETFLLYIMQRKYFGRSWVKRFHKYEACIILWMPEHSCILRKGRLCISSCR